MKMKPKFRLHVHRSGDMLVIPGGEAMYWTCAVAFPVGNPTPDKVEMKTANSGPCIHSRGAIAEAALLMRRATGHAYR